MQVKVNIPLKDVAPVRITPYVWDVIGYMGGALALMTDEVDLIVYFTLFAVHGILNILFDVCTVEHLYTSDLGTHSENLGYRTLCITNKQYHPQTTRIESKTPFDASPLLECSTISFVVHFYNGISPTLKSILYVIYVLGITKKNFVHDTTLLKNMIHQNSTEKPIDCKADKKDIEGIEPNVTPPIRIEFFK